MYKNNKFNEILAVFSWLPVLIITIIIPIFFNSFGISFENRIYYLSLLLFVFSFWIFLTSKFILKDLFNLYNLFILAVVLFNGSKMYLEFFGYNELTALNTKFNLDLQFSSTYLFLLFLVCFHSGGLFSCYLKNKNYKNLDKKDSLLKNKSLYTTGMIFFLISVIPSSIFIVKSFFTVVSGGYSSLYDKDVVAGLGSGIDGVFNFFSPFFVTGCFFLFSSSRENIKMRNLIIIILLIFIMSYFLLGYRRYGTMIFMGSLWIWHKIIRPVPIKRLILIGLFLLIFVFPTIKLIRGDVGEERLSINNIIYAYFSLESPVVAILNEMGGTIDTISYTLQLIPDYRPFALGSTYFYAFTSIFPNFFWDLHPAVEYGSLARWLIKTVDPSVFLRGGGLGYSFMAEAYANFGWIFGAFFVGVVGFFMAKLTLWAKGRGDNAKIAVVAICMANILLWSRGDATVVFRPLFYCAFLAYYGNKIVYKLLERYYLKKIN